MRKTLLVIVIGVVLATAGAVGFAPQDDSLARSRLSDPTGLTRGDLDSATRSLEDRVRDQPRDGRAWSTLAHVYVEQSRVTGDLDYYGKADRVIAQALDIDAEDDSAFAAKAALAAARHDFRGALEHADAALRINSYQPSALAVRIDALAELGRYDDQLQALRVANERAPGPPVLLRMSYAHELRGQLDRAVEVLELALDGTTAPTDRAFTLTILAENDRKAGRLDASEARLRDALAADPEYGAAYAARARLAFARGDLPAAERLWRETFDRTQSAESALELAQLHLLDGREDLAAPMLRAAGANRAAELAAGVNMDLEIAQFEADHGSPGTAVAAARREWDRRQSVHSADALAWALRSAGRSRAALPYAVAATRLSTPDPRFWLHRAAIEAELGMRSAARRHIDRALEADAGVSPWLTELARKARRS